MPRNSSNKCSYCKNEGHTIRHCNSEEGNIFNKRIRSRAIDYIFLENLTIHERAKLFHTFLRECCYVQELKLLLSKIRCTLNGNRIQLAAKFVLNYFIKDLGLCQFPRNITNEDRHNIHIYLTYWKNLADGIEMRENNEVNYKFPIKVVLNQGISQQEYFECSICMEEECPNLDQVQLGCSHSFCATCLSVILTNSQNKKTHPCCALCRADVKNINVHNQKIMEDYNNKFCYSI